MIMNITNIPGVRGIRPNTAEIRGVLESFHPIGFMGYRLDKASGCYILGNGYRMYNPIMRAFYSPDSESPFGAGGLSRYAYCGFDPVNFNDPSGNMSVMAGVGIGLGILGILLSGLTLGASLSLLSAGAALSAAGIASGVMGVASGVLGVASGATGIAASALEDTDPATSAALGWASLGLGIGSLVTGGVSAAVKYSARSAVLANNVNPVLGGRWQGTQVGGMRIAGNWIDDVHGYPGNVLMKYRGQYAASGRALGATVGEFLETGDEIMLTSCFGGFGGRISPAQLLANQTGRTVRASFGTYEKISSIAGLNRTFAPLTGVAKALSNAGGLAFSGVARGVVQSYLGPLSAAAAAIPPTILAARR